VVKQYSEADKDQFVQLHKCAGYALKHGQSESSDRGRHDFSNSALHWILDHEAVFSHFWQLVKPNSELLIECDGH
jgi:hypothetical protein